MAEKIRMPSPPGTGGLRWDTSTWKGSPADAEAPPAAPAENEVPVAEETPAPVGGTVVPYAYFHVACQHEAFWFCREPVRNENLMAMDKRVRLPAGGHAVQKGRTSVACTHCGAQLTQLHHRHVREARE